MRGYFEIGIYATKTDLNVGTLWRSAYQLGAAGIFTIGARFQKEAADTTKCYRHVPLREYKLFDEFRIGMPSEVELIAIEMGGQSLTDFQHPIRAMYLLGAEDFGIPDWLLRQCNRIVSIPSIRIRANSYNVSAAGTLVMYDRAEKRGDFKST